MDENNQRENLKAGEIFQAISTGQNGREIDPALTALVNSHAQEIARLTRALAEMKEQRDMADQVVDDIRETLESCPCPCGKTDHANTPPMMFPEWIVSIVNGLRKALANAQTMAQLRGDLLAERDAEVEQLKAALARHAGEEKVFSCGHSNVGCCVFCAVGHAKKLTVELDHERAARVSVESRAEAAEQRVGELEKLETESKDFFITMMEQCRDRLSGLLAAYEEERKAWQVYLDFHGVEHSNEDCPEDDTCDCPENVPLHMAWRRMNAELTLAERRVEKIRVSLDALRDGGKGEKG